MNKEDKINIKWLESSIKSANEEIKENKSRNKKLNSDIGKFIGYIEDIKESETQIEELVNDTTEIMLNQKKIKKHKKYIEHINEIIIEYKGKEIDVEKSNIKKCNDEIQKSESKIKELRAGNILIAV